MTKEKYLDMMDQMGSEPKPEEIPPDQSDFTYDTMLVFEIYSNLRDEWDGFSGGYKGKDLSILPMLFDLYGIGNNSTKIMYMYLLNIIVMENIKIVSNKIKMEQKRHGK